MIESLLSDHNVRVVVLGAALLGAACGIVGTFLTLRRRALVGDAVSHAALPGVAIAFLVGAATALGPRSPLLLLAGGALGGAAGVAAMLLMRRFSPLRDDAIVASVIGVFFGAGVVLLSVIQGLDTGHAAGLESFIYGRAAAMVAADAWTIAAVAGAVAIVACLLAKEWQLLCFDESFAKSLGWRIGVLDGLLMALVTIVTVAGMQAVGLILVVALQVIPAAAARFWSDRLGSCVIVAAGIGAAAGVIGSLASAAAPAWPSGAVIVLTAAACFCVSMFLGRSRGVCWRWIASWRAARRVAEEHLLRTLYELEEGAGGISMAALAATRRFRAGGLRGAIRRTVRAGQVRRDADGSLRLTTAGRVEADRVTARHRLWEHFLIERAGVAPSHVDRDADLVEHVLSPELLSRVAKALGAAAAAPAPASPHPIKAPSFHASDPEPHGGERPLVRRRCDDRNGGAA